MSRVHQRRTLTSLAEQSRCMCEQVAFTDDWADARRDGCCTFRKGSVVTRPPYATSSPMYIGMAGRVLHGASPLHISPEMCAKPSCSEPLYSCPDKAIYPEACPIHSPSRKAFAACLTWACDYGQSSQTRHTYRCEQFSMGTGGQYLYIMGAGCPGSGRAAAGNLPMIIMMEPSANSRLSTKCRSVPSSSSSDVTVGDHMVSGNHVST